MNDWTREERIAVCRAMNYSTRAIDESMAALINDARQLGERGWTLPTTMEAFAGAVRLDIQPL